MCIFQQVCLVLSNVLSISLISIIHKRSGISLEMKNIDQEYSTLLDFNHFVKNITKTFLVLMERKNFPETLQKETYQRSYIIITSVLFANRMALVSIKQ